MLFAWLRFRFFAEKKRLLLDPSDDLVPSMFCSAWIFTIADF